jgi:lipid A 3-O-deacylase
LRVSRLLGLNGGFSGDARRSRRPQASLVRTACISITEIMNQPVAAGPHRRGRRWIAPLVRPARLPRPFGSAIAAVAGAAIALTSGAALAAPADAGDHDLRPASLYVQPGLAQEAQMLVVGATWDWRWHRDFVIGRLSGYWEASFGRWNSDDGPDGGSAWVTQIGVTPVLRLYPHSWGGRWFVEGGIGGNFLLPIYRSESKRFSTAFNFGDHLAIGRRFGHGDRHELALRIQHFSNAGIRKPNPGEDFLQLRYSRRF